MTVTKCLHYKKKIPMKLMLSSSAQYKPIITVFCWLFLLVSSSSEIECESDGSCHKIDSSCRDQHTECQFWAKHGECDKNPHFMTFQCAYSCGTCDNKRINDDDIKHFGNQEETTSQKKANMSDLKKCEDLHALCPLWAKEGECLINPNFMTSACVLSCWLCVDVDELRMRGEDEDTM